MHMVYGIELHGISYRFLVWPIITNCVTLKLLMGLQSEKLWHQNRILFIQWMFRLVVCISLLVEQIDKWRYWDMRCICTEIMCLEWTDFCIGLFSFGRTMKQNCWGKE